MANLGTFRFEYKIKKTKDKDQKTIRDIKPLIKDGPSIKVLSKQSIFFSGWIYFLPKNYRVTG